MLSFLPSTLRGCIAAILLILNTLVLGGLLLIFAALKILIPITGWRNACTWILTQVAELWITVNSGWMKLVQNTHWQVEGLEQIKRRGWYLVTCNHQSWADIVVAQHLTNKKAPFLKFFLKQQLIWVPVLGLCWWARDFPFMQRYSKAFLAKYPEKKGKDLETTRKACEKFSNQPVSIFNFMEGTRFTSAKHKTQQSPFQHLLKPRAGGAGFVLGAMGSQLKTMVNITICYDEKAPTFWDFLCGRTKTIKVKFEVIDIPEQFLGRNYLSDEAFRSDFQVWVNNLWQEKDQLLSNWKTGMHN